MIHDYANNENEVGYCHDTPGTEKGTGIYYVINKVPINPQGKP
jgi:hypothetical protein